jgi:hypothetical protein
MRLSISWSCKYYFVSVKTAKQISISLIELLFSPDRQRRRAYFAGQKCLRRFRDFDVRIQSQPRRRHARIRGGETVRREESVKTTNNSIRHLIIYFLTSRIRLIEFSEYSMLHVDFNEYTMQVLPLEFEQPDWYGHHCEPHHSVGIRWGWVRNLNRSTMQMIFFKVSLV